MLKYLGGNLYEFYKSNNELIILSKEDVDTICDLAMNDSEYFSIGSKLEQLADDNQHWRTLYEELKDSKEKLIDEIRELIGVE